jgi:HTH-type transcriptional regulator/antitoxin HipB
MTTAKTIAPERDLIAEGEASYREWRDSLLADPEGRALYEEEAAKMELWLLLVEARQDAGLTQEQMAERLGVSKTRLARIETNKFEDCTLDTLRRYVKALGDGFVLEVTVRRPADRSAVPAPTDRSAAA